MKKSVLSLLAIAIASVSVFTSCDKNDDGYGQSAKTTTVASESTNASTSSNASSTNSSTTTYTAKYFIEDCLAELGTFTVTVSDGTKSATYDLVAQGQRGTYDNGDSSKKDIRNGYIYTVSQPSDKPLTFTVAFTPNDKVKSLTDETELNGCFAFHYTIAKGGHANSNGRGCELRQLEGSKAVDGLNNAAKAMSKKF